MSGEVIDTLAELLYNSSEAEFKLDLIRDDLISAGVQDLQQIFAQIALTNGQVITIIDLENFLKKHNVFISGNDTQLLFAKMDKNENTTISFKEFQDFVFPKMDTIPAIKNNVIHRPYTKGLKANPLQRALQLITQFLAQELKNLNFEENIKLRLHQNPYFEYEKTFELIDLDHKSFISEDDLYDFMSSLKANFPTRFSGKKNVVSGGSSYADELDVKVERVMRRLDRDSDGKIGIRDWTKAVCTFMQPLSRTSPIKKALASPQIKKKVNYKEKYSNSRNVAKKISFDAASLDINASKGTTKITGHSHHTSGGKFTYSSTQAPVQHQITRQQVQINRPPQMIGQPPMNVMPPTRVAVEPITMHPTPIVGSPYKKQRENIQTKVSTKKYSKTGDFEEIVEKNSPEFKIQNKIKMSPESSLTRPIVEEQVTKLYPPKVTSSQVVARMNSDKPHPTEGLITTTTEVKETNPDYQHKRNKVIINRKIVPGMMPNSRPVETVTTTNGYNSTSEYINSNYKKINEAKMRKEKLPNMRYDSPSRYSEPKSPVYTRKEEIREENTYISRRVSHDLSKLPVPQNVAPLTETTSKLLITTLTEMIHDYRVLEKARIDLSLRTDFNIR